MKSGLRVRLAGVAVSGLALWLVFRQVDLPALGRVLMNLRPGWFLLALLVYGLLLLLGAWRWHLVLRLTGGTVHAGATVRAALIGHFFNAILVGPAGGDVAKSVLSARWYRYA